MKHSILFLAALALLFVSCKKDNDKPTTDSAAVTFYTQGDWQWDNPKDLSADGTSMTDVWVLDYVGTTLVQTIHQNDNTASDFGTPTLNLSYGIHTLYFVASRGLTPTLNTTDHTIVWTKPSDTFHKTLTLTVNSSTASSQAVALDRSVAKLKLTINDAIAEGTTAFTVTPATWYYGIDYTTGNPTNAATNQAITVNCPSSNIGQSGKWITVFSLSPSTQWNTNVTLAATDGTNTISSVTLSNVPLQRNYSTEYSGNLFTLGGGTTLSLNDTWTGTLTGTW